MIDDSNKITEISDNFIIIIDKSFNDTNFHIPFLELIDNKNEGYNLILKYTIDQVNFLNDKPGPDIIFYPVLFGEKIIKEKPNNNLLYIDKNIDNQLFLFSFSSVEYDSEFVDFKLITLGDIINILPKWNFYDNMQQTLNNWKRQIVAMSEMYGHQMSYFKTDPVKTDKTFQNNYVRDVVDIKKLLILVPNNNLPNDTVIYSEWDYAPVDEIYFDIVDYNFKHAFGDDNIPMQGDAIFFPLINKYFRVTSVQPKNGFMGYIGWWNVYLTKYEEDESIGFSDGMQEAISGTEFETEYNAMLDGGLIDAESILEDTITEKNDTNENYTNRLVDGENFIDLKETENLRAFIHNRLEIISLRPETQAFPVTMYDCSTVKRRNIALVYDLIDYTKLSKLSLTPEEKISFSFNIATEKFQGEILDLLVTDSDSIYFTYSINRNLELMFNFAGENTEIITILDSMEYYQVVTEINNNKTQILIYKLNNGVKSLVFTKDFEKVQKIQPLSKINLYGGNFYINDITVNIDDKKIMQDYCNPIFKSR